MSPRDRSDVPARRRDSFRGGVGVLTAIVSIVSGGIWVNLLTDRMSGPDARPFAEAIGGLGAANVWLLVAVLSTAAQVLVPQLERRRARRRYASAAYPALQQILALTAGALRAPNTDVLVNARYFAVEERDAETFLLPVTGLHFESTPLPGEFGMERISTSAEGMVVSRSYRERTPLYAVLPRDHVERYDPSLRAHIDPRQGWVLACPVVEREKRDNVVGVVCLYGVVPPVSETDDETTLLNVATLLSSVFERVLPGLMALETTPS